MAGRAGSSTTDDHGTSTAAAAPAPAPARGLPDDARPPPPPPSSVPAGSDADAGSEKQTVRKPKKRDYVPPSAHEASSKKRPCPAGQVQKPKKRPSKDNSDPLFVKAVQKAMHAKDMEEQERKKRPASSKNDLEETIPWRKRTRHDDSFDCGGQQGTRTRDRMTVVHEVDKYYDFIMGDKDETRQHHSNFKKYIILKEKDPGIVLTKIEELLSSAAQSCRKGNGCSFKIPSLSKKQELVPGYGWAHMVSKFITYDLSKKMRRKTVGLVCVLSLVAEAIKKKISITNRQVYYSYMDVFGSQNAANHIIASICGMFKCTKSSLMIVAESEGEEDMSIELSMAADALKEKKP